MSDFMRLIDVKLPDQKMAIERLQAEAIAAVEKDRPREYVRDILQRQAEAIEDLFEILEEIKLAQSGG